MKALILSILLPTLSFAQELPFANHTPTELEEEALPLGYEAVTGVRSDYIYRGRELGGNTLDFQFHGYFSYADDKHLEYGAWYAAEIGDGNYQESGIMMHYIEDVDHWSFGVGFNYRDISQDIYKSGFELNASVSYHFNADQILLSELSYDTGAEGWYGKVQYNHYQKVNADSFLNLQVGISLSSGYYEAQAFEDQLNDGFNDLFAKVSYTYNLTKQVSISPFIGTSVQKNDATLYGGLWFETSF